MATFLKEMDFGNEAGDGGGKRIAFVLVAVIMPSEVGGEAARLEHLGDEHRLAVADGCGPPGGGGRLVLALGDRFIERMNAGVIPGLVTVDQRAGPPGFVADMQAGGAAFDGDGPPAVEGERQAAVVVELAFDDHPTFVGDEPRGRQRRPGLPVEGEAILVWERCGGARVPLTVELDGAGGMRKQ